MEEFGSLQGQKFSEAMDYSEDPVSRFYRVDDQITRRDELNPFWVQEHDLRSKALRKAGETREKLLENGFYEEASIEVEGFFENYRDFISDVEEKLSGGRHGEVVLMDHRKDLKSAEKLYTEIIDDMEA